MRIIKIKLQKKYDNVILSNICAYNTLKNDKELVQITDYEDSLLRLCNAVILKYIGVNNPRLDCSKWYTRFPLIK